jgi:Spy/CpxP family protein refolding chaperone
LIYLIEVLGMMRNIGMRLGLFATAVVVLTFMLSVPSRAFAQDDAAQQDQTQQDPAQRGEDARVRPNDDLTTRLNLTADQVRQIRQIRVRNRLEWRDVRERLAAAQQALDDAIYSNIVDEALIETRVRELGAAQAAQARMRAVTELSIRRVLTADQLVILRRIREEAQQNVRNRANRLRDNSLPQDAGSRPNVVRPRDNVSRPSLAPRNPAAGRGQRP